MKANYPLSRYIIIATTGGIFALQVARQPTALD